MRKIFDNWFYNYTSVVASLFWFNLVFGILLVYFAFKGFCFFFIYFLFYTLFISPIFVAKARDKFLKEMDLYVDDE